MTVQIDDAGWGCLLGGTLIGAYRVETGEYACGEIPVEFFQGAKFGEHAYLGESTRVVADLLDRLQAPKDEPVEICTGYVLAGARDWLRANGYNWRSAKIAGPLQELVERSLLQWLHDLGLDDLTLEILTEQQGKLFYRCLKWLKGGDASRAGVEPEREKLAKTGWKTYPIWAGHPYHLARIKAGEFKRQERHRRWRARREYA